MATKKQLETLALEQRYRFRVKMACLGTLVVIVLIDAIFDRFNAPIELELALIAIVAGIETREIVRKKRVYKKLTRKGD